MANGTSVRAAKLQPSTLPQLPTGSVCQDHIEGFCRRGNECAKSHAICAVPSNLPATPVLDCPPNLLSFDPRVSARDCLPFDNDGPGHLSRFGPRHDNDYEDIQHIQILPTAE